MRQHDWRSCKTKIRYDYRYINTASGSVRKTLQLASVMHFVVLLSALVASAAGVPVDPAEPGKDTRFVGGSLTDITAFPYQLSLQYDEYHFCGAAIIGKAWAVTAAQCVNWDSDISHLTVRAGSTNHGEGGTIHSVTKVIKHEKFNEEKNDYDIALLKVSPSFTYTTSVKAIGLQETTVSAATKVNVTGWQTTAEAGCPLPYLQYVTLQIQSDTSCPNVYWKNLKKDVTPRMICAGTSAGGKGACEEDIGAPLVAKDKLVGIASWSEGCGEATYPGVYTKISALRDWIKTNAGV